jgi:signal transduction histidine kinase
VAETLELVRGSLPANIRLDVSVPELTPVVIGDPTQLHQVVMNLCSNAIQALSGGGTLHVAIETADFAAGRTLSHGSLGPGRYVRLTVADTGTGMDETTLIRIFEPFFTTKEIGRGTGLGLSLVYAIVIDSGGAIDVETTLGAGSVFTVYLPHAGDVAGGSADEPPAMPSEDQRRVLVVDDEEPRVKLASETFEEPRVLPSTEGRP